ncbi:MAG: glycerol-3-phosphate dehydrogenase/oxidase [Woeseiaceae bacterium]
MQRDCAALAGQEFDVAIIGGGAFGAAAAWHSALRGLRTALIERSDFGGGASAECFKMVHGGIRYLQHADLARLRSSCHERSELLRLAPHLVAPLPIVIPTYGRGRKGKAFLGAGMRLYDLLTLDRNARIRDPARRISGTRFLGRSEILGLFPSLEAAGLTGGAIFEDGQMYSPPRLVLEFVKSAVRQGAVACNYVEAVRFRWQRDRICGAIARDRLNGEEFEIRARLILNAAGPGAEYLLEEDERFGHWRRGVFSRDACFVVRRKPRSRYALAVQGWSRDRDSLLGREARHMFIVPWRDYSLVGVWHKPVSDHPDAVRVDEMELGKWIEEINACYPELALTRDDVVYKNCGLVPFGTNSVGTDELSFGKESRFIDHSRVHRVGGLVTLVGIRFTNARGDSAKALELLLRQLPGAPLSADTSTVTLAGGRIDDFDSFRSQAQNTRPGFVSPDSLDGLLRNYGTEYTDVLQLSRENGGDGERIPGAVTLGVEITHAVQCEMAVRLEDVVLRRTDLGSGSHPGTAAIHAVADRMQRLLGWSADRRRQEVESAEAALMRHGAA